GMRHRATWSAAIPSRSLAGMFDSLNTSRSGAAFRRRWLPAACLGFRAISHTGRVYQHGRHAPITRLAAGSSLTHRAVPLSAREHEVAVLVARGLTNRQIAEQLVIAPRTADNHVQHIFDKLGVSSRAQVAAWVAARGLLAA